MRKPLKHPSTTPRLLRLAPLLLAVLPWSVAAAQAPSAEALAQLDGFALGLQAAGQFSGTVLIASGDDVVFEKAYGTRDEQQETPLQVNDRFNLASAGKMFTSVAILQQIAAGRLSLDSKVGEVLKDYPNRQFANEVSVRQLLTHSAGAGDIDELFGAEHSADRARLRSLEDMVALHAGRAPEFAPGSAQKYGNFGYLVLGRMLEVLSGQDFESYIRQHVLQAAGMQHTGFVACDDPAADLARAYVEVDGKRVRNCATQPDRGLPAGGEVGNARDMFRFVQALNAGKLLPAALFEQATQTQREFMGLGFFATGYGKDVPARDFRWGHGGSTDGVCTDVRHYPATGETVIVLSNKDAPACFAVSGLLHAQWKQP